MVAFEKAKDQSGKSHQVHFHVPEGMLLAQLAGTIRSGFVLEMVFPQRLGAPSRWDRYWQCSGNTWCLRIGYQE